MERKEGKGMDQSLNCNIHKLWSLILDFFFLFCNFDMIKLAF